MERKIILDTNIWISIFLRKKNLDFLEFVINKKLILIADINLRNELLNVISRKKFNSIFSMQDIVDAMEFFDMLSTFINTQKEFSGSPDVKDDYLFDLAKQTNSKILVTGDKKLLHFKNEIVSVISLKEFLENIIN